MNIVGVEPSQIIFEIRVKYPEIDTVLARVEKCVPFLKRQIAPYQGAALYALAKPYNGGPILEIGTAWGYSAAIMAEACPESQIITLNPKQHEVKRAAGHLRAYRNVSVLPHLSWDFFEGYDGRDFDLIFVDGDHKRVRLDFPWYNRLSVGGLMFFHDYSPDESGRPCPPVYDAINQMSEWLRRRPDVLVIDDRNVGMAGFVRRGGETAPVE